MNAALNKNIFYGVIINNFIGVVFSCILSVWFNASIAGAIGLFAGMLISITAYNASISFPRVYVSNIVKYVALHIPDFIFQVLLVFLLRHGVGCNKFLAYTIAALLGMPIAFLSIKKMLRNDDAYYGLDFHNDPRSFIEWINEHQVLTNACIFILMTVFFSISNWSLLLGENLMKWDIWDAEYFNQVLMTDALANHTIPMWNPLMQYGSPWYSVVGSPIWYPFTMILAYIGYTPVTISISYVMHVVIGSFGMFLLVAMDAKTDGKWTASGLCAGIVGGLLYGGCGVFLSNAEHIMIIISAAWVPYVFYYMRRFIAFKRLYYGGMAGLCAGLIFLGGYPEMFYNLFLFLFIYVLIFCYQQKRGIIVSFGSAMFRFGTVCAFTVFTSAISLLPFLSNKDLIARGNGAGVSPQNYPLYTLLSALFPAMMKVFTPNVETSMVNYYMGILVILLIPMLIKSTHKYKRAYSALAIVAFMLCWSSAFFVHSIFYRFLPMYSAFRFPTTNRTFLSLFMILLVVPVLKNIMDASADMSLIRFSRIIFWTCSAGAIFFGLMGNLLQTDASIWDQSKCMAFSTSAFISAIFVGGYLLIFSWANNKKITGFSVSILLTVAACIELLTFAFIETPISIAMYAPTEYSYNGNVQISINDEWEQNRNRVRDVNFANHARSLGSGIYSREAVFNKTFDEDGYVSFRINNVDMFKKTYIRNIIGQNPVIYFTNDVVTMDDISYEEWANACDTPPEQIFVEQKLQEAEPIVQRLNAAVERQRDIDLARDGDLIFLDGYLYAANEGTGRVRVYLSELQEDILPLELWFMGDEEASYECKGNFLVHRTTEGTYVDIFFPDTTKIYGRIQVTCPTPNVITGARFVVTERMTKDSYVDVSYFGFNDIVMTVDAPSEGYVTLLQTKHDGWSAYVDGVEKDISLVDQCFMGIHLDAGEHTIVMKFRPKEFFIGAILTGICVIVLVVLKIGMLWKGKRNHNGT